MLSFRSGVQLAEISTTKKKAKPVTIYLNDDDDADANHIDSNIRDEILPKSFYTGLRNVSPSNMTLLKKAIRNSQPELIESNNNLLDAYNRAQELLKDILKKFIEIPKKDGKIEVIPEKESTRTFIAGPSASGKSTWIGNFLEQYSDKYPKNKIYIISPIKDDPAFKAVKPEYVKLDDSIVNDPLTLEEFCNSMIVFDDIESIKDKRILEAVKHFMTMCLEAGRHENISVCVVSHVILNGQATKVALNECNVVLFPKTNFSQISKLCSRYYGFGRNELDYIKNVKSRWIYIRRDYPVSIVSENAIKLL